MDVDINNIPITDENFLMIAAKSYQTVCLDDIDFMEDINRFKYLKKLFSRFKNSGDLNDRLILNHLVILYNIFENKTCTRLLAFRLFNYLPELVPFLEYMNYLPEKIEHIGELNNNINIKEIKKNQLIVQLLESLR